MECGTETCALFVPKEKYNELMEAYEKRVLKEYKPNRFPLCGCDDVSSLWVSHSSANPDRPYFRCQGIEDDDKCEFFKWADESSKGKKKRVARKQKRHVSKDKVKHVEKPKRVKAIVSSDDEEKDER